MMQRLLATAALGILAACHPAKVTLQNAATKDPEILFYSGSSTLDDLLIVDGVLHFGKAQYQVDDPLGDIGFRFNSGERIQSECIEQGETFLGDPKCLRYEVYRSSFDAIPIGTQAQRPER